MFFIPAPKALDPATDPRYTHTGKWSSWLIKAKSDGAKAKWFQTLGRRYFTIDFDRQVIYYAHGENVDSQVSTPIKFADILGAHPGHSFEPDPACEVGSAKGGLSRSFSGVLSRPWATAPGIYPFTVRTLGKRLRLESEVESEMFHWIAMLNAASRIGRGVEILKAGDELEVDDRSLCPRVATPDSSTASARSDGKSPSLTSEKASQQSTTADGEENGTDAPPSPNELSDAGNMEELTAEHREEPQMLPPPSIQRHTQEGLAGPCLRGYLGSSACSLASGSRPGSPREAESAEYPSHDQEESLKPAGWFQAADFGFEDDELGVRDEASPESSPIPSPRAPPSPKAPVSQAAEAETQQVVLCEGSEAEDEASPASQPQPASLDAARVASDMLLLQRQFQASSRPKRRSKGGIAEEERCRGDAEDLQNSPLDKEREARVAADLMLLQAAASKRSSRLPMRMGRSPTGAILCEATA
mmetsp:Transcript_59890/g.106516  ORF Transcript_59890/g.106516 Transcript_59890/m.106516 type:complete len:473 (-) Transcript_59890:281-1699(-)|eukprot:CAMPEP_0197630468 /NCGR_PEP_ID=MMETSP1338-20131121/7938_1 /TAXON_ID=43686 ORGANISM="Pelagodinium beii, Strain RCC1491" /NCGR_SAMPLE_ID=MMETSP1338 /ASSEMBLY_ACC=CAM_ASM_000754 /LENGTH=472 /DNA_ID=CAMNT_0043201689 /DNA_START=168 /DNA_END=1586 /DNA_ORIENTATION=+